MKKSIILKSKLWVLGLFITTSLMAQEKITKIEQSIKVNDDVTINLNTSYCNVVFDTWNKNEVEIKAYVEGNEIENEALKDLVKSWKVNIDGSESIVSIHTTGNQNNKWKYKFEDDDDAVSIVLNELKHELANLPHIIDENLDINIEMPELPELPEMPEGIGEMHFDYDAYQKDGEKYIKKYTKQFESKFGNDFEKKMEAWGDRFEKHMEVWALKMENSFDSDEFEEKLESWGERFEEQMERHAEELQAKTKRVESIKERAEEHKSKVKERGERAKENVQRRKEHAKERARQEIVGRDKIKQYKGDESDSKIKKIIIIKMPKEAKIKVNVRHGALKLISNVNNLKANLSHTKFIAHSINGSSTSVNASYSPVMVTHWNLGELNLNYVEDAKLNNVKRLVLNLNTSNMEIQNITNSAIINSSIGNLNILSVDDTFNNLSIMLQNSDAIINLPKTNYNLQYSGNHTAFSHPENLKGNSASSFSKNALGTNKTIVLNAKYSKVIMK